MNIMTYKGYGARIEYDAEDECFVGRLAGINDVIGFHASDTKELKHAFREAVDDYVETCKKAGKSPERLYSGNVMCRIDPEIHAKAALEAQLKGISLNQWVEEVFAKAVSETLSFRDPS